MDTDSFLVRVLEWAWVAVFAVISTLYRKVVGLETQQKLLEQNQDNYERRRQEDREVRAEHKEAVMEKIDLHHKVILERVTRVETLIKNGH